MGLSDTTNYILVLVISALGLLANTILMWFLFRQVSKKGATSRFYYLLIGLTLSDILLLILSLTRTLIYLGWLHVNLGHPAVAKVDFVWDWICTGGTKYYTVAISLERYFVICFPLQAHRLGTPSRYRKFAIAILLLVVLLAGFSYLYFFHMRQRSFEIYVAVTLHFLPFAAVLFLNLLIYFGLRKHQQRMRNTLVQMEEAEETNATRILFAVVVVFGVCYSFEFLRRILNYANYYDCYNCLLSQLANIFYVLNSSINFVVYCLLAKNFRDQFFAVVCSNFKSKKESWSDTTRASTKSVLK